MSDIRTDSSAGVTVPNTPLVDRAIDYARRKCEPYLFNHVMRSWLFAVRLGQLKGIPHDAEIVAVGTLLLLTSHPAVGWDCFVPAKRRVQPVSRRTIRAFDFRMLPHVEVDVGMIVRRQQTNAIESGYADLDAVHAYRVEKYGHLRRPQKTLSLIATRRSSGGLPSAIVPKIGHRLVLQLRAVVPQGQVERSNDTMRSVPWPVGARSGK